MSIPYDQGCLQSMFWTLIYLLIRKSVYILYV